MEECKYCGDNFESKEQLLRHKDEKHNDELSTIDQRKIEEASFSNNGIEFEKYVPLIAILFILLSVGSLFFYLLFASGGVPGEVSSDIEPNPNNPVHIHGQITVSINGDEIDFSREKFKLQDPHFHFEGGNGDRWHVHAGRVSLEYGLETLGFSNVTDSTFAYQGKLYSEDKGDTVEILVNGEEVDPKKYILQNGDTVRVVIENN